MTVALGARQALPREENDFYRTPNHCTEALLRIEQFDGTIWEPACGDGAISQVLEAAGHDVFSTDLIERGYGHSGFDFLSEKRAVSKTIVTNPPFKLADRFVLHAHDLGATKIAMLLRLCWLEGERRRKAVFAKVPPNRIHVFSRRPTLWNGADPDARQTGGAIAYAWFVWDATAPAGLTSLSWIAKH